MRADIARVAYPLFHADDGGSSPTSALQLNVREVNVRQAQKLNDMWHSVLPDTHLGNLVGKPKVVCYEAEFNEVAYAVAIWTSPIAANRLINGWSMLELRRLAIADDAPKNTASRMLRIMRILISRKFPDVIRLISYQAEAHHSGTIYKASGWTRASRSESSSWHKTTQRDLRQTGSAVIRWEYSM